MTDVRGTAGLAIRAAAAVRSPTGRGWADDPAALGYFQDLLGPFGAEPDKESLHRGAHVHHEDLVDLLAAADGVRDSRPGLLIVTHALPDVVPFTAVAPYFTARLGAEALCFSVAQQGLAAPFTALRIAAAYQRSGRASEVVLAVLEQTTLPTAYAPAGEGRTLTDSGAAFVLAAEPPGAGTALAEPRVGAAAVTASPGAAAGAAGPAQRGGPRLARVASGTDVTALLAARRVRGPEDEAGGAARTLVVLGAGAERYAPAGVEVHRAAPDVYCTGVWLELAANWAAWQEGYDRIVLCDTDPRTGWSHVAEFAADRPR